MKNFWLCLVLMGIMSTVTEAKDFGAYWVGQGTTIFGWAHKPAAENGISTGTLNQEGNMVLDGVNDRLFINTKELGSGFYTFPELHLVRDPRLAAYWKSMIFETDNDLGTLVQAITDFAELGNNDKKMMMNILYHLWRIVPLHMFQGPGEQEEESKELLSRSLSPNQVRRIMEYYTHAAWDPTLVKSLYATAKEKYAKVGSEEETVVLDDGAVYRFYIMYYTSLLDQYVISISWDGEWQGVGIDGDQNVLFYDTIPPPWPNRLSNRDASYLLATWAK